MPDAPTIKRNYRRPLANNPHANDESSRQLQGHFFSVIGAVACLWMVNSTPNTPDNESKRLAYTLGHAACLGNSLGPVLQSVAYINPKCVSLTCAQISVV